MLARLALAVGRRGREVDGDGRGAAGVGHAVTAGLAAEEVGAAAALEQVVAVAAEQRLVAVTAGEDVVAGVTGEAAGLFTLTVAESSPSPSERFSAGTSPAAHCASCAEMLTQVASSGAMVAPGSTKETDPPGPGCTTSRLPRRGPRRS